jgi:hypothetical protein
MRLGLSQDGPGEPWNHSNLRQHYDSGLERAAGPVDSSAENHSRADASASENSTFKEECSYLFIPSDGPGYFNNGTITESSILAMLGGLGLGHTCVWCMLVWCAPLSYSNPEIVLI